MDLVSLEKLFEEVKTTGEQLRRGIILEAIDSGDLNVMGLVQTYLSDPAIFERISPRLKDYDYYTFLLDYFERCIRENVAEDGVDSHALSPYEAAETVRGWFSGIYYASKGKSRLLGRINDWLAKLYMEGDESTRRAVVDGTLEHLFEDRKLRRLFADWEKRPELRRAYAEADAWVRGGGKSIFVALERRSRSR